MLSWLMSCGRQNLDSLIATSRSICLEARHLSENAILNWLYVQAQALFEPTCRQLKKYTKKVAWSIISNWGCFTLGFHFWGSRTLPKHHTTAVPRREYPVGLVNIGDILRYPVILYIKTNTKIHQVPSEQLLSPAWGWQTLKLCVNSKLKRIKASGQTGIWSSRWMQVLVLWPKKTWFV